MLILDYHNQYLNRKHLTGGGRYTQSTSSAPAYYICYLLHFFILLQLCCVILVGGGGNLILQFYMPQLLSCLVCTTKVICIHGLTAPLFQINPSIGVSKSILFGSLSCMLLADTLRSNTIEIGDICLLSSEILLGWIMQNRVYVRLYVWIVLCPFQRA